MKKIIIYEFQDIRFASRANKEAKSLCKEYLVELIGFNKAISRKKITLNENLTIIEFPIRIKKNIFFNKVLNIILLNFLIGYHLIMTKADVYFMHNLKVFFPSIIAKKKYRAKLVYDAHELHIGKRELKKCKSKLLTFYDKLKERYLIKHADLIIQASDERATFFSKFYHTPKPFVLENHTNNSNVDLILKRNIFEDSGIPEGSKIIIFTGFISMGGNQNIENTIKCLPLINNNFHLCLLGPCIKNVKDQISQLSEKEKVKNRVHLLDAVLSKEVVSYISHADMAIIPIKGDTLNSRFSALNKVSQSLMAGLPLVCSNYLNLHKLVNENPYGKIGATFDVYNPESIANAINSCFDLINTDKTALKNRIKKIVNEKYNWEKQEESFFSAIDNMFKDQR